MALPIRCAAPVTGAILCSLDDLPRTPHRTRLAIPDPRALALRFQRKFFSQLILKNRRIDTLKWLQFTNARINCRSRSTVTHSPRFTGPVRTGARTMARKPLKYRPDQHRRHQGPAADAGHPHEDADSQAERYEGEVHPGSLEEGEVTPAGLEATITNSPPHVAVRLREHALALDLERAEQRPHLFDREGVRLLLLVASPSMSTFRMSVPPGRSTRAVSLSTAAGSRTWSSELRATTTSTDSHLGLDQRAQPRPERRPHPLPRQPRPPQGRRPLRPLRAAPQALRPTASRA